MKIPVSSRVREIEKEIDGGIHGMAVWRQPRDKLLERIIATYRDAIEVIFVSHLMFRKRCYAAL